MTSAPAIWIRKNMLQSPGPSPNEPVRSPTEAEMRVKRSLEKLSIPDWYLNNKNQPPKILANATPIESRPPAWKKDAPLKKSVPPVKPMRNVTVTTVNRNGLLETEIGPSPIRRLSTNKIHGSFAIGGTPKKINGSSPTGESSNKMNGSSLTGESKEERKESGIASSPVTKVPMPRPRSHVHNISATFPRVSPSRKIQNINIVFPPLRKVPGSHKITDLDSEDPPKDMEKDSLAPLAVGEIDSEDSQMTTMEEDSLAPKAVGEIISEDSQMTNMTKDSLDESQSPKITEESNVEASRPENLNLVADASEQSKAGPSRMPDQKLTYPKPWKSPVTSAKTEQKSSDDVCVQIVAFSNHQKHHVILTPATDVDYDSDEEIAAFRRRVRAADSILPAFDSSKGACQSSMGRRAVMKIVRIIQKSAAEEKMMNNAFPNEPPHPLVSMTIDSPSAPGAPNARPVRVSFSPAGEDPTNGETVKPFSGTLKLVKLVRTRLPDGRMVRKVSQVCDVPRTVTHLALSKLRVLPVIEGTTCEEKIACETCVVDKTRMNNLHPRYRHLDGFRRATLRPIEEDDQCTEMPRPVASSTPITSGTPTDVPLSTEKKSTDVSLPTEQKSTEVPLPTEKKSTEVPLPSERRQSIVGPLPTERRQSIFGSLPMERRQSIVGCLPTEKKSTEVPLPSERRQSIVGPLPTERRQSIFGSLPMERRQSIFGSLPMERRQSIFGSLPMERRQSIVGSLPMEKKSTEVPLPTEKKSTEVPLPTERRQSIVGSLPTEKKSTEVPLPTVRRQSIVGPLPTERRQSIFGSLPMERRQSIVGSLPTEKKSTLVSLPTAKKSPQPQSKVQIKEPLRPVRKSLVREIIEVFEEKCRASVPPTYSTPTSRNFVKKLVQALENETTPKKLEAQPQRAPTRAANPMARRVNEQVKRSEDVVKSSPVSTPDCYKANYPNFKTASSLSSIDTVSSASEDEANSVALSTSIPYSYTTSSDSEKPSPPMERNYPYDHNQNNVENNVHENLNRTYEVENELNRTFTLDDEKKAEQEKEEDESDYWIPVKRTKLPRTSSLLSMMSRLGPDTSTDRSPCVSPIQPEEEVKTVINKSWGLTYRTRATRGLEGRRVPDSGYSDRSYVQSSDSSTRPWFGDSETTLTASETERSSPFTLEAYRRRQRAQFYARLSRDVKDKLAMCH